MFFFSFGTISSLADTETRKKFLEAERYAAWVRAAFLAFGYLYLLWNQDDPRVAAEVAWPTLALITVSLGLGAEVLLSLVETAARGLVDTSAYVEAVIGR
jgi:preprotein translocase subunit SecY